LAGDLVELFPFVDREPVFTVQGLAQALISQIVLAWLSYSDHGIG
jgi:hypothetical protein